MWNMTCWTGVLVIIRRTRWGAIGKPRGPKIGVTFMKPWRNADLAPGQRRVSLVFLLALASALVLVGIGSTPAADSASSQCAVCHTDAAKLKSLTPADPPSAEEGEG
jgi:hypothetical protein